MLCANGVIDNTQWVDREHDEEQGAAADQGGHLEEVLAEDAVLGDHGEAGLETRRR